MNQPATPRHLPPAPSRVPAKTGAGQQPAQPTSAPQKPAPAYLSAQAAASPAPAPVISAVDVRDPIFFHHAVGLLSAALVIPSGVTDESDDKNAVATAEMIAKILDTGTVPEGYITPAHQAAITQSLYYLHSTADGQPIRTNEGEKAQRHEQLQKHIKMMGEVKTVDQIKSDNAEALAVLADISEPVRAVALMSTAFRLAALGKTITGAHPTEAVGIAVHELLRSIKLAEKYGVPAHGLDTVAAQKEAGSIDEETAQRVVPYPGSIAATMAIGMLQAVIEEAGERNGGGSAEADPVAE